MKNNTLLRALGTGLLLAALAPWGVVSIQRAQLGSVTTYVVLTLLIMLLVVAVIWAGGLFSLASRSTGQPRSSLGVRSSEEVGKQETGTVKWFDAGKGYGFILRDSGPEIFVHYRSLLGEGHRSLYEGQRVAFVIALGRKGLQAEEVTLIEP